ncbi:hypothetical protein CHH58_13410 [Terribacillus saccharophilus]|nr:hypothetical protein CHH58_13410 [Terribacillus saccharophilus]
MARYTNEEKLRAVKRLLGGEESSYTISSDTGMARSNIQFWARKIRTSRRIGFYEILYKLLSPI